MVTTTARRRKKPARADLEEEILEQGRWSGLREQHRLERQNHSEVENEMARIRMKQFLAGGTAPVQPPPITTERGQSDDPVRTGLILVVNGSRDE